MSGREIRAVLFDLDGTLIDSAPDLLAVLAELRSENGLAPMELAGHRHVANQGAAGLIELGFGGEPGLDHKALRQAFLERYAERCFVDSRFFPGVEPMLEALEELAIAWGVVTNKPGDLARSVLQQSGWLGRAGCLVAGDTLAVSKPDPEPVRLAARQLGLDPAHCLVVGDDSRDVRAGRQAGTMTCLAAWGYLGPEIDPTSLGADRIIEHPGEVLGLVEAGAKTGTGP